MRLPWSVMLAALAAPVLLAAVISVLLFRQAARDALWQQQGQEARDLATALAAQIDAEAHGALLASADPALYAELLDPLLKAHRQLPEIYYVYTLAWTDAGDVFVLDTATRPDLVGHGRTVEASALGEPAPDAAPEQDEAMRAAMRRGDSYVYPEPYTDAYGTFLTAQSPLLTKDGMLTGYVGIDFDISTVKAEWAAIDRYAGTAITASAILALLLGGVGALLFRRERSARDQAERYADQQAQFLAMISHDVRTPLNGIIGNADLLLLDADDSTGDNAIARRASAIKSSGETLCTLFSDILDFSKFQTGHVPLAPEPINLLVVVDEVVSWVEQHANPHQAPITARTTAPFNATQNLDPVRLRQVLLNLVSNAARYGAGTPVDVHLASRPEHIEIIISDQGPGISTSDQARIFEPFVQGKQRDTSTGSGLGLAIVALLVKAMDGTISVVSEPNQGAQFTVTIPPARQHARASTSTSIPRLAEAVAARATADEAPAERRRVLVVDDLELNRDLMVEMLAALNITGIAVGNATQATERTNAEQFDAILLDVHMPEVSGIDWLRQVRQDGRHHDTPIIMLTGDQFPDTARAAMEAGADLCLTKPVQIDTLAKCLGATIG